MISAREQGLSVLAKPEAAADDVAPDQKPLPGRLAEHLRELTYGERAVAWLQIDAALTLTAAGGHLDNYGLATLHPGAPAVDQAFFLEGLLPLTETPYFVPSIELGSGRAADLHFLLDDDATTWVMLFDVTAERDSARRVQQKAYDMTLLQEREAVLNRRLEAANAALLVAQRELEISRDVAREALHRKQIELNEARTLQLALAPPPFEGVIAGRPLSIDVLLEPAKEVGGDIVDHFRIGDDLLVIIVGDVSDKGAGAALMMARTHALFRGIAARPDAASLFHSPEGALGLVNATLAVGNLNCMFVTLFIATLDATTGRLSYVRAGHVPPFLRRVDGSVERLPAAGGLPLGLMDDAVYTAGVVDMHPGDQVLIVTDGITEAADTTQALFGESRVATMMAACEPGVSLVQRLLDEVREYETGHPQSDDISAILLTLEAAPRHG
jgi:serine phosphatase RsbU (regulator of sigma subunit)